MAATEAQKAAARARYWSDGHVRLRAIARSKDDNQLNARYLKRYGLTLEDYTRMHEAQKGACAICGTVVKGRRMCVDHDHETGAVRALLCQPCNRALGQFNDSEELLLRAVAYLKEHQRDDERPTDQPR